MSGWAAAAGGIIVALITAIASLWVASITRHASPYDAMVKRVSDQDDRIDELQEKVDLLRTEVGKAQDDARASRADAHEARNAAEAALDENVAWTDHHLEVVHSVAALRRPWPQVPHSLQHRLAHTDYPAVPIVPTDAVPDPADDGQDDDPTTTT